MRLDHLLSREKAVGGSLDPLTILSPPPAEPVGVGAGNRTGSKTRVSGDAVSPSLPRDRFPVTPQLLRGIYCAGF